MSKKEDDVQGWIADRLSALDVFGEGSVYINRWTTRDDPYAIGARAIIATADDFAVDMQSTTRFVRFVVPIVILVPFDGWDTAYNTIRDVRQAIIDSFISSTDVGNAGAWADTIANGGVITEVYDPYTPVEAIHESLPIFVSQQINVGIVYP